MGDKKVSLHEHPKALYPGSLKIVLLIFSFKEAPFTVIFYFFSLSNSCWKYIDEPISSCIVINILTVLREALLKAKKEYEEEKEEKEKGNKKIKFENHFQDFQTVKAAAIKVYGVRFVHFLYVQKKFLLQCFT